MKRCSRCDQEKEHSEFNLSSRNKDGLHAYCRECQKGHYVANKSRHVKNVSKANERYRKKVRGALAQLLLSGCIDCGAKDIRVLEFDHAGNDKVDGVMTMVRRGLSIQSVLDEAAKCDIRCRNCHAIKTYDRMGGSWHNAFVTESGFYPVNRNGVENVGSNPTGGT